MKISDLDAGEMIEAISQALAPVIFRGIDRHTAPQLWLERAEVSAEIMGRITAALHCGDEISPDIADEIKACVAYMKASYRKSYAGLLGPDGPLSKL